MSFEQWSHRPNQSLERPYASDALDRINARKRVVTKTEGMFYETSRGLADTARDLAYNGSYKSEPKKRSAWIQGKSGRLEIISFDYEYVGTAYVMLDFNRHLTVREIEPEDPESEVKVILGLRFDSKQPDDSDELSEIIATFSEDDSVKLEGIDSPNQEDLENIKELLEYIQNSRRDK